MIRKHWCLQCLLQILMFHCFKKAHQTLQNTVFSLTFDAWLPQKSRPNTAKYSVLCLRCIIKVQGTAPKTLEKTLFSSTFEDLLLQESTANIAKYNVLCFKLYQEAASEGHWPPQGHYVAHCWRKPLKV